MFKFLYFRYLDFGISKEIHKYFIIISVINFIILILIPLCGYLYWVLQYDEWQWLNTRLQNGTLFGNSEVFHTLFSYIFLPIPPIAIYLISLIIVSARLLDAAFTWSIRGIFDNYDIRIELETIYEQIEYFWSYKIDHPFFCNPFTGEVTFVKFETYAKEMDMKALTNNNEQLYLYIKTNWPKYETKASGRKELFEQWNWYLDKNIYYKSKDYKFTSIDDYR